MTDNQEPEQQSSTKGKERRGSSGENNRKSVSVRLTKAEHRFFIDVSNALGKTLSVLFRDGAKQYAEDRTDLKLSDYEKTDPKD